MTNYVFLANGFEEIEALTTIDVMRRAGMSVTTVSINPGIDGIGAHNVVVKAFYVADGAACADYRYCCGFGQ